VVKAVSIPVVAAGGIGDGSGLLAMLSLGAQGVQMGTRFIATQEALVHEKYKKLIVEANDTETVIVGRTMGRVRRLLNTEYARKLQELEVKGITLDEFNRLTDEAHHIASAIHGDLSEGHLNSGQIAGLIDDVPTVSTLIKTMIDQAKTVHGNLNSILK
jgi:enoyl-[acyl-carrier protein] reductase II